MDLAELREYATSAIRYWEPLRIIYNAILAGITIWCYYHRSPDLQLTFNYVLGVFIFAVTANAIYSVSYVFDLIAQASMFRGTWLKVRPLLFAIVLAFASAMTYFVAAEMFRVASYS